MMSLTALLWGIGVVFGAAVFYATVNLTLKEIKKQAADTEARLKNQIDGVGRKARSIEAESQRRWLHEIADRAEELEPQDKAKRLAHRIREEAWRN